jgi:hypothetical protein
LKFVAANLPGSASDAAQAVAAMGQRRLRSGHRLRAFLAGGKSAGDTCCAAGVFLKLSFGSVLGRGPALEHFQAKWTPVRMKKMR